MRPMERSEYAPRSPRVASFDPDEAHLHSFRLRGYRFGPLLSEPSHEDYVAHLTARRIVLEPLPEGDALSMPWNDIIEFQPVRGSRIVDEVEGVEEHMMLVVAKDPRLQEAMDMLLLTAEPVDDPAPMERDRHSAAFLEIVEELLVEAFEA